MDFRVIKKEQQLESNWSGGKTYELAIFPRGAKYLDRDFLWRLSTANSDREESSFTKLPDYDRILMVLEGDVVLAHGDQRSAHLQALEQDTFDGAVKTRCFGRLIRDYNLIYAKGCQAKMELKQLFSKASPVPMSAEALDAIVSYGVFCLEGYAVVSCGEASEMIRPGEQAVIDFPAGVEGDILVMGEGQCIVTEIIMAKAGGDAAVEPGDGAGSEIGGDAGAAESTGPGAAGSVPSGASIPSGAPGAFGAEAAASGSAAKDATAFADYVTSLKLYFGRNRWAMIMRREGRSGVYYDKAMSTALRKLERWFILEAIWLIGVLLCMMPVFRGADPKLSFICAVIFTAIHLFGIVPGVYMQWLPRPFSAHMKKVSDLNAAERAYYEKEIREDPHFEKLMRKYKSDDENYFADESSPLNISVKKK